MSRRILPILVLTTALAVPAGASAGDKTLLSGYGGPGGGEQSALGSQLLPPPRGNGSLRAASPRGVAVTTPAPAASGSASGRGQDPATGAEGPGAGRADGAAATGRTATGGRRDGGTRADSGRSRASGRAATPAGSETSRVQSVTYPPGDAAGALPISASGALLLLLGLAAVMLVGAAMRALSYGASARELGSDL